MFTMIVQEITQHWGISICLSMALILLMWHVFRQKYNGPPGPMPLPIIGNSHILMGHNIMKTFRDLRSKYGDVYMLRFGFHDVVMIHGYENIKELLVKRGEETVDRPLTFFVRYLFRAEGIFGSCGSKWRIHRAFAIATLRKFGMGKQSIEEQIMEEVVKYLRELETKKGKPFNSQTDRLIEASVCNIIGSILVGKRFEYNDTRFTKLLESFSEAFRLLGTGTLLEYLPCLRFLPTDPFKGQSMINNFEEARKFIHEIIEEHKQKYDEECVNDFIDAFIKEMKQNRQTFTDDQLITVVLELMMAGTETTSSIIVWIILYLYKYPDVEEKMKQEIDAVVGTSRLPSLRDRANLPYCQAVITEISRHGNLSPFVQLDCSNAFPFKGFTIPKGAFIMANLESIMSDSQIFEDADQFKPERFIDKTGNFYGHEKVLTFSIGKRACLGESLARSQLFLYATSMVQRFKFVIKGEMNQTDLQGILSTVVLPKAFDICAIKRT